MKFLRLTLISIIFISACGKDKDVLLECPEVTLTVIIPAVNMKFFDENEVPLNVCNVILTIDSVNRNETIYGSALNNCSEIFSLRGGYDLIEHNLLVEKVGYVNQTYESVLPTATQCAYETLDINVFLTPD